MGEETEALSSHEVNLEVGLATVHPHLTLATSLVRTIVRLAFHHEPSPLEYLQDYSNIKSPGSQGAHVNSEFDSRMQNSDDTTKQQREAKLTLEILSMIPIESPRQGQVKRGSPTHSTTQQPAKNSQQPKNDATGQPQQQTQCPPFDENVERARLQAFRESISGPINKMMNEMNMKLNQQLDSARDTMTIINQRLSMYEIHQGNMQNEFKAMLENLAKNHQSQLEAMLQAQNGNITTLATAIDERTN
ncbi:unnamed protein product, partial [Aphanomyces euteiches]